jgi:hypothetical protein
MDRTNPLRHESVRVRSPFNLEHLRYLANLGKPRAKIQTYGGLIRGQYVEIDPLEIRTRHRPLLSMGEQPGAKAKPAVVTIHPHAEQAAVLREAFGMGSEIDMSKDPPIWGTRNPCSAPAGSSNGQRHSMPEGIFFLGWKARVRWQWLE